MSYLPLHSESLSPVICIIPHSLLLQFRVQEFKEDYLHYWIVAAVVVVVAAVVIDVKTTT